MNIIATNTVKLIKVNYLQPTEHHYEEKAIELRTKIERMGYWTKPILTLKDHYLVLDGHHRLAASIALGLIRVPCILVAQNEPLLRLTAWRDNETITIDDVISRGTTKSLFPPKSTRFHYDGHNSNCQFYLDDLRFTDEAISIYPRSEKMRSFI